MKLFVVVLLLPFVAGRIPQSALYGRRGQNNMDQKFWGNWGNHNEVECLEVTERLTCDGDHWLCPGTDDNGCETEGVCTAANGI